MKLLTSQLKAQKSIFLDKGVINKIILYFRCLYGYSPEILAVPNKKILLCKTIEG